MYIVLVSTRCCFRRVHCWKTAFCPSIVVLFLLPRGSTALVVFLLLLALALGSIFTFLVYCLTEPISGDFGWAQGARNSSAHGAGEVGGQ